MSKIPDLVREYIRDEQRGLYTVLFAIVEQIDEESRRCQVVLKDDENVLIDDVPVAASFAGNGYGEVVPIEPGETEGLLLCAKDPIQDILTDRGQVDVGKHRQHSFQDAIFFPQIYFDTDTVPTHDPGEYLLSHPSGSAVSMGPNGAVRLEEPGGSYVEIGPNGIEQSASLDFGAVQTDDTWSLPYTQTITTGFQPSYLELYGFRHPSSAGMNTEYTSSSTTDQHPNAYAWSHGEVLPATQNPAGPTPKEMVAGFARADASTDHISYLGDDYSIYLVTTTDGATVEGYGRATVTSFNTDGFDIEWQDVYEPYYLFWRAYN